MILKIDYEEVEKIRNIVFSLFKDSPGRRKNIYLYHMYWINKLPKKICEKESGVSSTAYYNYKASKRIEVSKIEELVLQVIKFKEAYNV